MRRLISAVALLCALLAPACNRRKNAVVTTEEETPAMATMIHVADPRALPQLKSGFHEVEQNAWRWTMSRFAVQLRPPRNAGQQGATLEVRLTVPQPVIDSLKAVTLSARIGDTVLPPETYKAGGAFVYTANVPAKALGSDSVLVEFSLDKFLAAGSVDHRELGVVISSIGFEGK